jgi:acetate kinase
LNVLVLNPGSASLKFDIVRVEPQGAAADAGRKLVSGSVEVAGGKYGPAARDAISRLEQGSRGASRAREVDAIGLRVVHGGERFDGPARIEGDVLEAIAALEELAPLHNAASVAVARAARESLRGIPLVAVFDTSFHRTIPRTAHTYAIPFELAARHGIRRYGFHGTAHRYMVARYARAVGADARRLKLVTLHLESGASACAVDGGRSVDTSMGLTPLEGLVMGTRCGDLDPAIIGLLARRERVSVERVFEILNRESGLLGLSGVSLDTRVLAAHLDEDRVRLALDVFCHRLLKYVGAYLALLGGADAVVFGGGIGQNTPLVRERVCRSLDWCGLRLDEARNGSTIDVDGRISSDDSRLHAHVIVVEEALQIAHEVARFLADPGSGPLDHTQRP